MLSLFTVIGFGFILGLRHATDADHVVAITTLLARHGKIRHSTLIGILWGIGHSITVTLIAIPIIFYSFIIPQRLESTLEFLVGVVVGMMIITTLLGASIILVKRKSETIHHYLITFSGILSLASGLYIIYQISFLDGLVY